jgi:hypothetical protein
MDDERDVLAEDEVNDLLRDDDRDTGWGVNVRAGR